jgi:Protein of unknown function (DUF3341)
VAERVPEDRLYGLLAEFESAEDLLRAAERLRARGYRQLEGYTPFPLDGLAKTLGFEERRLPFLALAGGIVGGVGGISMQWYLNAYDYAINVGGRPLDAWPAFAIPAFEMTVLGAVLAVVLGMLWLNGLPRLHHPLFDAPHFERVTRDRFLLSIEYGDPRFDRRETHALLEQLGAASVEEVPL